MENAADKKLAIAWLACPPFLLALWVALDRNNPASWLLEIVLCAGWMALTYHMFVVRRRRRAAQTAEQVAHIHAGSGFSPSFSFMQGPSYFGLDRRKNLFHVFDLVADRHSFYNCSQFTSWEVDDQTSTRPTYSMYFLDSAGTAICHSFTPTGNDVTKWRAFVQTI